MRLGTASLLLAVAFVAGGCVRRASGPTVAARLDLAETALRDGNVEDAAEWVASARAQDPRDVEATTFSARLADLYWRDDEAIREMTAAVRLARSKGMQAHLPGLRGQLGEYLFRAGRFGESATPLLAGALDEAADVDRRRAFAILAGVLPFVRRIAGPLVTEQPLLAGDAPEFVCGTRDRLRPFAIDTGTSMTTVASGFAEELGVRSRQAAGTARDAAGRPLAIEVGILPQFRIGNIDIGAVPVLVVDDDALRLRDLHGGPERVPRGVLGLDLLAAFRLSVDPERGSVVLELPRGLPAADSVQCIRVQGRCMVPVVVEGARLWFVLDTGASHSSLTPTGLARLTGGEGRAVPSYRRVRTVGGALVSVQEVRDLVLRCSDARFLHVTLPVVARAGAGAFPVHGVLGIDLLGRCRVTLDRGRARLTALR